MLMKKRAPSSSSESNQPNSLLTEAIFGNQDLANEILLCLPPKSLAKSRCISKQFFSLISNPNFERRYSLLHPPSFSGLFLVPTKASYWPEIEYLPASNQCHPNSRLVGFLNSQDFKILQSCNGLLLCLRHYNGGVNPITHHICNPTTRQFIDLPRNLYMRGYSFSLTLAYDPLISPYYKVICVEHLDDEHQGQFQISIYSSETGLWFCLQDLFVAPKGLDIGHGVYCIGNIHWMKGNNSKGLYFNIDTKCIKSLPELPTKEHDLQHQYIFEYFGQSQGCLNYVVMSPNLSYFEVFEMNKEYSGWLFKFRIDLSALAHKFPSMVRKCLGGYEPNMSYECEVLSINREPKENDRFRVWLCIPGQVIEYSHKKKTSWKVCDSRVCADERRVWYRVYKAFEYNETISPL